MELRALGPLEVILDGQRVDLGSPKQRSLLAALLVHADQVVSTERLLEDLWGPDAAGKENALWVQISRLRSAFEPGRTGRGASQVLLRKGDGYVLSLDGASYDVTDFERLTVEGRELAGAAPAEAAARLNAALELWRGPAFDEFRYEDFAQAEITRLDEARTAVLEDRIDADLACGRAGELVSELEVLRHQHPHRERPVGQLMLALYRSGRPADALRVFTRFRQTIGDELGIDPSPALRRLEEQILLHDDGLQRRRRATKVRPRRSNRSTPSRGCVRSPRTTRRTSSVVTRRSRNCCDA